MLENPYVIFDIVHPYYFERPEWNEGTPTQNTTLIEDGVLVGYMQDRLNARLMATASTGNGRRQSFAHQPMPRMRNTYMEPGPHKKEEIIQSVKKGIYAEAFTNGEVYIGLAVTSK